eukprot:jgi/Tetstr1/458805/TSEL_045189.t1
MGVIPEAAGPVASSTPHGMLGYGKKVALMSAAAALLGQGGALDLAEGWQKSELGRYYQAGKRLLSNVMFNGEGEVCEVKPHSETAELHGFVGILKQQHEKACGIIKSNTNAVKNLAATQALPGRRQRQRGQ